MNAILKTEWKTQQLWALVDETTHIDIYEEDYEINDEQLPVIVIHGDIATFFYKITKPKFRGWILTIDNKIINVKWKARNDIN